MSSAVRTATTPGDFSAAVVSIRTILAWHWLLRRKASCSARSGFRSAVYSPLPVSRRGSSVRLMGAPTFFGRTTSEGSARRSLFIAIIALAQVLPLLIVVPADNCGAAPLNPTDLFERLQLVFDVPSVTRGSISIKVLPQADGVRREQELAVPLEAHECAHRP